MFTHFYHYHFIIKRDTMQIMIGKGYDMDKLYTFDTKDLHKLECINII